MLQVPSGTQRPWLIVADATVNQDRVVRRPDHVRLEAERQIIRSRQQGQGFHPVPILSQDVAGQAGQERVGGTRPQLLFDDPVDLHVGHFEGLQIMHVELLTFEARVRSCVDHVGSVSARYCGFAPTSRGVLV